MNIVLVSNGHGEDRLAAALGQALLVQAERLNLGIELQVAPLSGEGLAYAEFLPQAKRIKLPQKHFPSEGFLRTASAWWNDLQTGLLPHVFSQYRALKKNPPADIVIAVGDFFALAMSRAASAQKRVFVPTAKSDRFQPHLGIELFFIERWVNLIFPRDAETAASMQHTGVPVWYVGNLMMDCLDGPGKINGLKAAGYGVPAQARYVIGILPGSHREAYGNLKLVKETIDDLLTWQVPMHFVMAVPKTLDLKKVKTIMGTQFPLTLVQGRFRAVIDASGVVLGFAGTANEQAVGLGKPVVTMPGKGTQTSLTRIFEQSQLLLGGVHVIEYGPCEAAEKIKYLLTHPTELVYHAELAEKAMGKPGAAARMAEKILLDLK